MIVVINYDTLESLPPVMSLLIALKKLGKTVFFIGVESGPGVEFLKAHKIAYKFLPTPRRCKRSRFVDYMVRLPSFIPRRMFLRRILDSLYRDHPNMLVWFQQVKSAALLGNACFKYPRRVLTIFELYDRIGCNWLGFNFKKLLNSSTVVVPEYNRAWIIKSWYNLQSLPFVVPNKNIEELMAIHKALPESVQSIIDEIAGRPIFLYQGAVGRDRRDLLYIIETIAKNRPQYVIFMLSNETAATKTLANKYHNIYYHPLLAAPSHLSVTCHASVGIAVYNDSGSPLGCLNSIYCAPNKIYEYAAFGVPVLGNSIPGLVYSIGASGAGLCCDMSEDSILKCADRLVGQHQLFSAKALQFYKSCDLSSSISAVLSHCCETPN